MNQDTMTKYSYEKEFYVKETPGKSFLLSSDDIQLILNMAESLKDPTDRKFIKKLAKKEYITNEEKKEMDRIFIEAISKIRSNPSVSA
ncbi:hypothetical protein EXM22_13795 [Oceanispirochaeta crateris]|uniref:Uncharacterized protein n=1 Tax=Oceanispirochaeta crateris TaxID=2518645 RepID=A0A5C1QNU0_9SPIO|nr:hypothetical protein [Oceanispirochaeta crateris]QEN09008.1 hypothetical protein EXM22_13795 [Oceanispirochaeta crateris]